MDGAGYFDIQELENGNLAFVESNKLTVRYHEISVDVLDPMKRQLNLALVLTEQMPEPEGPVFNGNRAVQDGILNYRAPGIFQLFCFCYSCNKIIKAQNEHLNIVCPNLNDL